MRILVAGATGKTGLRLVDQLLDRGHQPIALIRESSDTSGLSASVEQRLGDLTDLQDDLCHDCEAVIFAAGSGGNTGADMTEKVDRQGAMRLIDLAAQSDVDRFVMLSSVGADNPDPDSKMAHYIKAKHDADEHLKASGLDFAIIRPVRLTEEDGSRDMTFGDEVDVQGKASRGDVAAVLARAVDEDTWLGQATLMQSD